MGTAYSWSDRLRGGQPENLNAWDTMRAGLPAVTERLQGVLIAKNDAFDVIESRRRIRAMTGRSEGLTIYADPPYLPDTRTARKVYAHEMDAPQHARLLIALRQCDANVLLSGYRSDLYDLALEDWTRHDREIANHSGVGAKKQRRVECLWRSP
jgi:DNA adenine methylase